MIYVFVAAVKPQQSEVQLATTGSGAALLAADTRVKKGRPVALQLARQHQTPRGQSIYAEGQSLGHQAHTFTLEAHSWW